MSSDVYRGALRADFTKFQESMTTVPIQRTEEGGVSALAALWLDALDRRQLTRRRGGNLAPIPTDCLVLILQFLTKRVLVAVVPTVCKLLHRASRSPVLWSTFRIDDLIRTSDLPLVSKFVVLRNVYDTEKEYKENFWLRQLADGRFCGIQSLELQTTKLRPRDVTRIFPRCPRLKRLDLSHAVGLDDTLMTTLLDVILHEKITLTSLSLTYVVDFSAECFVLFAKAALGKAFVELDISGCQQLSCDSIRDVLATMPWLRVLSTRCSKAGTGLFSGHATTSLRLEELNLSFCAEVQDSTIEALATAAQQLKALQLESCPRVSFTGLKALFGCTTLVQLNIAHTTLDDAQLTHVLGGLVALQELVVDRSRAGGSVLGLALSRRFKRLSAVNCVYMKRDVTCNAALKRHVQQLSMLSVGGTLTNATLSYLDCAPSRRVTAPVH